MNRTIRHIILLLLSTLMLTGCNTQKNTSTIRWWKGFKARYNTYFNGHQAYLEGMSAKIEGNKDNYTKPIPLLMVSNKQSQKLGSSQFETTVTKCEKAIQLYSIKTKPEIQRGHKLTPQEKAFRNRKEFNPFLKNAWILMGKAQLEKGEFLEASATFSYIQRLYKDQPQIANVARSLQALCYTELDWYYDAEDILRKVKRDSIPKASRRVYNTAICNYHLRQKEWKESLPYLTQEVKWMPHGTPRARGYFLLGQIYRELGMKKEAYKAFGKCMNQSPPYEMRISAQVLQTEVMPEGTSHKKIAKLRRMSKRQINKDYIDQIFYAIGNLYLAGKDTLNAIKAYEEGRKKGTRSTDARTVMMIKLGDLYWDKEDFDNAMKCYGGILNNVDKEDPRYKELSTRQKVLAKLVPHTNEIHLQDSLQALANMSETDRNAVIDLYIEHAKKLLKEQMKQQKDSIRKAKAKEMKESASKTKSKESKNDKTAGLQETTSKGGTWYFYDDMNVIQGKEQFAKIWGNRENADNWRRQNKEKAALATLSETASTETAEVSESDTTGVEVKAKGKKKRKKSKEESDSITEGPLSRKYYLDQLPLTEDQMKASNKKLSDALLKAGVIEKDELDNYHLCNKSLGRLYNEFPNYEKMDELLYHLFLMELHWGSREQANIYRNLLAEKFPESKFTELITSPTYEEDTKYGKHMEDSIYAQTYDAFRTGDYETIRQNCEKSKSKYPKGENRPKFRFLEAMMTLHDGDVVNFAKQLRELIKDYDKEPISEVANNIIRGIQAGKVPQGNFSMADLWASRNELSEGKADSTLLLDSLKTNKMDKHILILTYAPDSVNEGQLLYEVSRFNFTNFDIRNFDIDMLTSKGMAQMRIKEFANFDEIHRYQQELYQDSICRKQLEHVKPILISEHNLKLIGVKYSFEDYMQFYEQNYLPSKVKKDLKLDQQPDNFIWDEFQEVPEEPQKKEEKEEPIDDDTEDGGEWF